MPTLLSSLQIEKTLSNARKPSFDLRGAIMMTLEGRTGELRLGVTIRSKSQTREQKNGQALLRGEAKKRWREPPSIWTLWHKIEFIYRTGSSLSTADLLYHASKRQVLEVLPGRLKSLVDFADLSTLAYARRTFATCLASDQAGDRVGPLASISTLPLCVGRDVASVHDLVLCSAEDIDRLVLVLAADGLNSLLHGLAARGERQSEHSSLVVLVLLKVLIDSIEHLLVFHLLRGLLVIQVVLNLNLPELVLPFLRLRLLFSRVLHALKLLHTLFPFGDLPLDLVRGGASDGNDTTNALCNARFLQDDQVLDLGGVLDMSSTGTPILTTLTGSGYVSPNTARTPSMLLAVAIEPQLLWCHQTTSLVHLLTQHFPQCKVKDGTVLHVTSVKDIAAIALNVLNVQLRLAIDKDAAGIILLTTLLSIKVCAVEDQADLLAFGSSRGCVNERIDVVDIELNQVTTGLLLTLTGFPGFLLRLSNRIFVNRQASFLGHNACEIDWKAVCIVETPHICTSQLLDVLHLAVLCDLLKHSLTSVEGLGEGKLLLKLPISTLKYFLAYRAPLRRMRRTTYPRPTLFGTPPSDIANARVRM
ncbi:alanyl-tRNA synthetase [Hortaea werneckii]|nr:alanyl-tRNA synthetase [Hortaea werneckii]